MSNRELKAENQALAEKVTALENKIAELSAVAAKPISKGKQQAEAALALLKAGSVTMEQLKAINEKYPNDPIYFVRTILKQTVVTHRVKGGKTTYSLPAETPNPFKDVPEPTPAAETPAPTTEAAVETPAPAVTEEVPAAV